MADRIDESGLVPALATAGPVLRGAGIRGVYFTPPNGWDATPVLSLDTAMPGTARGTPPKAAVEALLTAVAGLVRDQWVGQDGSMQPIEPTIACFPHQEGRQVWPISAVTAKLSEQRNELLRQAALLDQKIASLQRHEADKANADGDI